MINNRQFEKKFIEVTKKIKEFKIPNTKTNILLKEVLTLLKYAAENSLFGQFIYLHENTYRFIIGKTNKQKIFVSWYENLDIIYKKFVENLKKKKTNFKYK